MEQAIRVLDAVSERFGHQFDFCQAEIGASAIEHFGDPLPDFTIEECNDADAVIIGAVGHPKYDNDIISRNTPDEGLLRLRKAMGLYCNIRPVLTFPTLLHLSPLRPEVIKNVDFVIFRELSSGLYFGDKGRTSSNDAAFDQCFYTKEEISRVTKLAFQEAMKRRKILTLVDRANVLETSRLWRETVLEIAQIYSEVQFNHLFVDHAAAEIIMRPQQFDVILTSNLFGDILSDAAGVIPGSVRLIPSASIGEQAKLFEPIYSAYPRGIKPHFANPIAIILSVAMMLDFFELKKEARAVRTAVTRVLGNGMGTPSMNLKKKCSTRELGDRIAYHIESGSAKRSKQAEDGNGTII